MNICVVSLEFEIITSGFESTTLEYETKSCNFTESISGSLGEIKLPYLFLKVRLSSISWRGQMGKVIWDWQVG